LIIAGVLGLSFFIEGNQTFVNLISIFGIVFLVIYAFLSFKSAMKNESLKIDGKIKTNSTKQVFTFLNPHVYLDTVLLMGSIGANVQDSLKIYFIIGCTSASALWFLSLGYSAKFLIPF